MFKPYTRNVPSPQYAKCVTHYPEPVARTDSFQIKLNKTDQIDSLIISINAKVTRLEQGTKSLGECLEQVEKCTQLISDDYDKQKKE